MARIILGKTLLITFLLILSSLWIISTSENVEGVKGNITGNVTWSSYTYVTGHIMIKSNANLTISAGVRVEFAGFYAIYIENQGSLYVNGASGNKVIIHHDNILGWKGIYLNGTNSKATINNAIINNSEDGIYAGNGGNLRVSNSEIFNNVYGFQLSNINPVIKNSYIHNNTIPMLNNNVSGQVVSNDFIQNSGAIIWQNSKGKPRFDLNYISHSQQTGIEFQDSNPHCTNNTIKNSTGHGISISHSHAFIYKNTLLNNGRIGTTGTNAGIYVWAPDDRQDDSIIDNNFIKDNGWGIILDRYTGASTASNISTVVKNNDLINNLEVGLEIKNFAYPTVQKNDITNNKIGVKVIKASPVVANSTIKSNSQYDWVIVTQPSMPISLNSDFDTVSVAANFTDLFLKVQWFLHVNVKECGTSNPVNGAEVILIPENFTSTIHQNRITDSQGKTQYMHVTQKVMRHDGNITYLQNFTIQVDKITFPRQFVAKEITGFKMPYTRTLDVCLDKNYAPSAPTGITPTKTHDTTPTICWTQSTDSNGDPITYYLKLGTTMGGGQVIPETAEKSNCFEINQTLQYDQIYYITLKAGDNRFTNSSLVYATLAIYNNKPTAPTIVTSPTSVYTDTNIMVAMTAPSTDDPGEVGTYGESIRYSVKVEINDVLKTSYSKLYVPQNQVGFSISSSDFVKDDVVNITVTPYDGHGTDWENSGTSGAFKHPGNGTPALISIKVLNHPPDANKTNSLVANPNILMTEDNVYIVPSLFDQLFSDVDFDKLKFEYETDNENLKVEFKQSTGQLTIVPAPNYFTPSGTKDKIIFKANDSAGGILELVVNVTVQEVNDAPTINVDPLQVARQDKRHYINITITDPADPHDSNKLTVQTNHSRWSIGEKITLVEHSKNNITLYFTPTNDDIGVYYLNISATDTKDTRYQTLIVTVQNVNDRPHVPVLASPMHQDMVVYQIYNTTNELEFEATAFDPDLKWGDELNFLWTSNVSGLTLGNKNKFRTKINVEGLHNITITVTDKAGLSNRAYFTIKVIDPFGVDLPQTELTYPKNNMMFPSTSPTLPITLTWEPRAHKYSDLFVYDLEYWEDDPNTAGTRVNGLTDTEYTLTVQVETTYFWWVIPRLGGKDGVEGQCFSGKWSFTAELIPSIVEPKAELLNPLNEATINTSFIELEWTSDDDNADSYFYQVYIDENPTPSTLVENYLTERVFEYTGLKDKTTYYWNVVPYYGTKAGTTTNGPFKFTVDLSFVPNPEISITPNTFEYDMKPTESREFTYTVENTGNTIENLAITLTPEDILKDSVVKNFEELVVTLEPGDKQVIEFTVNLNDMGTGTYDIDLRIISSDKDVSIREDVKITVKKKTDTETSDVAGTVMLLVGLMIVIIIIVIVVVLFLFRKKPKVTAPETYEERMGAPDAGATRPMVGGAPAAPPAAQVPPPQAPAPAHIPAQAPKPQLAPQATGPKAVPTPAPKLPSAAPAPAQAAETPGPDDEKGGESSGKSAKCPTCGSDIPADATECPICAAKIK